MTATNMLVRGKADFFENTDIDSIMLFINKFCRENPLDRSSVGFIHLLRKLGVPL